MVVSSRGEARREAKSTAAPLSHTRLPCPFPARLHLFAPLPHVAEWLQASQSVRDFVTFSIRAMSRSQTPRNCLLVVSLDSSLVLYGGCESFGAKSTQSSHFFLRSAGMGV